jgi:hypothetical protein
VSAYELQTYEGRKSNQVLKKTYTTNTGKEETLLFMMDPDTGAITILAANLVACAECL